MSGQKKKKTIKLVILLACLLILIGAYFAASALQKSREEKRKSEESLKLSEGKTVICNMSIRDIEKLSYTNSSETVSMIKRLLKEEPEDALADPNALVVSNERWMSAEEPDVELNQENAENMVSACANLTSERTIAENAADLSTFGLDEPVLTVEVTDVSGRTVILNVGDKDPSGKSEYMTIGDSNTVYLIPAGFSNNFDYSKSVMMGVKE